ncbi:MAG: arsenate reductase ArsC [Armatimonadota bacterium]
MKKVLFVCVHNSGRSQMAEAFARKLGEGRIEVESAGTEPAGELNPTVVEAMREIDFDMSGHYPKLLTLEMVRSADRIITMGCGVESGVCPAEFLPTQDWGLEDPAGKPIEEVRKIRDEIRARVEELVREITGGEDSGI